MSFHFFGPDWDFKFRLAYFYVMNLEFKSCLAYREISWAQVGSSSFALHIFTSLWHRFWSSSFALHVLLLARALGCWSAAKEKNVELQSWLLVSNPLADQLEVV